MATQLAPAPLPETTIRVAIHVTQADINAGCRHATADCPIARAMLRAFDVPPRYLIGEKCQTWPLVGVDICNLPSGKYVKLPAVAQRFIERFDRGVAVKPFTFHIEIPLEQPA